MQRVQRQTPMQYGGDPLEGQPLPDDGRNEYAFNQGFDQTRQGSVLADTEQPQEPADDSQAEEERASRIDALGASLVRTRKKAIEGRFASGIELDWIEDEDGYEGIDDANRASEHASGRYRYRKPSTAVGVVTEGTAAQEGSNAYLNITRPYVDAGAARIADMLLPADEYPFALTPTPIPELVLAASAPASAPGPVDPQTGETTPLAQYANAELEKAKKVADKAQKRIEDWMTESQWHGEARHIIDDAARIGTGVLKGPIPMKKQQAVWNQQTGSIDINVEVKPGSRRIDAWNCYPDPLCGENIHQGEYFWERDDATGKRIRDLKGTPGFIDAQIELVLLEGAQKSDVDPNVRPQQLTPDQPFEIWYFHGTIEREDLEAAGCDCSDYAGEEYIALPGVVTMINDRVVRATINPLENGRFPYDFMVWSPRRGLPWGKGISRQIRTPQRIVNAAVRNMMDNAGLSAGPQIVISQNMIRPANGDWKLAPRKIWYADLNKDVREVQHAFQVFNIECRQQELIEIITLALKFAEDITGMPALLQGQQGKAPDTVGGMTLLNNNANSVLRRIARAFDFRIIEPHVQRYYEWLLEYGPDESEKQLFIIDARGSSVLVERDLQNQAILGFVQLALQPAYGADPRKTFAEGCKAHKIDPERLQYTDSEWKTIQANMAKQQPDPRIEAAKIQQQTTLAKTQSDEQIAQMNVQSATQLAEQQAQTDLLIAGIEGEIKSAEISGRADQALTSIKAKLADRVMQMHGDAVAQAMDHSHERNLQSMDTANQAAA
jgi:hypothetical protein